MLAHRILWLLVGWSLISLVVILSLMASPPVIIEFKFIDKLEHLLAYSVLMGWFGQLYSRFKLQIIWVMFFVVLGVVLEYLQGWGGYRIFDYADMLANTLGVLLGWWLTRTLCAGWLLRIDRALFRS
jgi:VanZ family protein